MLGDAQALPLAETLNPYKKKIESILTSLILNSGESKLLYEACEYALKNGGKRLRPAIVLMIAEGLGNGIDVSPAALTIEYFHTASLVADDLPCMDDDDVRRNKPSLHKAYGEAPALLVSYALIAAGYEGIAKNVKELKKSDAPFSQHADRLGILALENATYNTGLCGATGGQFMDVFPPDLSLSTLREVIHKKTVSLFEIAFVFGWLFGGGDITKLNLVKKAASHFGMAFQIADDLDDYEKDLKSGRKVNLAIVLGKEEAAHILQEETNLYLDILKDLQLETCELQNLILIFSP